MRFKVYFSPHSEKDYQKLQRNSTLFSRGQKNIHALQDDPFVCKKLVGELKGIWSLRVGAYRIIYEVKNKEVLIASIKHRQDVYR